MAKLVKLHVSGIRSFGPYDDQQQQLKFTSPVTLILGQNGSGKTTIIEAIKCACTNEFPLGTRNGQGFVNDPKMSKSATTKGQIKLKLIDPRGNTITISRIMEVCQAATSLKFKSISSTIRTVTPEGVDKSLSGRCGDVTTECCQLMNVSSSVLNNVIFCHQENSLWPLDEGQKLKEKFDEIFDADRYNKCSEEFRKQLKEEMNKIKVLTVELQHRKERKEHVEKEKRTLQDKEDKLRAFEDDINTKNQELEPLKGRMEEIFQLEQDLGDLQKQLTIKETTKAGIIEEQNTIKKGLAFEFDGSDEELQDKIRSFEADRKRDEEFIVGLTKKKDEIDGKSKIVGQAIQEAQGQLGKLNQEKNQYEKKCSERKKLIQAAKEKMKVQDLPNVEENSGATLALQKLKIVLETSGKGLDELMEEKEFEEASLQMEIDEARDGTVRIKQNVASKENELKECEQREREISNELFSLSSTDERVQSCAERIKNIDKTIATLNNTFRENEESQKVDSYRNNIRKMESELELLESEHKTLQRNDVFEGKIESEKYLIMEKQREISRIKGRHSDSLKHLFGVAIPERNYKDSVLTIQKRAEVLVTDLTEKIAKKQKEVTTLEVQRKHQQEKVETAENELKAKQARILETCNGSDFNETLERTFQRKERLQLDKGQYSSVKIIYGQFIKKFEKSSPCCPVCETKFDQKETAVQKIVSMLKSKVEKVPQELERVENELQKEEATYNKLQQLKTVNDELEMLAKDRLPQLRRSLSEIEQALKEGKQCLEDLKNELSKPEKILQISRNIISDVSSLDQNQSDVEKSSKIIEGLKQDLIQIASNKSRQEVEAEIEHLKAELNELRGKVDAQTKKIHGHKDRIQELSEKRISLLGEHIRLKEGMQTRPTLEAQQTELIDKMAGLKQEVSDLNIALISSNAKLQATIDNREKVIRQNKTKIHEVRTKLDTFKEIVQEIQKIQAEIEDYLTRLVDTQLAAIEDKIEECKKKEKTLEETRNKVSEMLTNKKEDLAKHEYRFKTLQNNVILRQKKSSEFDLELEIQELRRRIGGYNYRTVYEEKKRLSLEREKLEKIINNLTGEKTALVQSIEELREQLAKPESKQAYSVYMSKLYELKITEHVIDDLNKYVTALEKAILDFHKQKMIQINKNIRELWRDIYRGNDMDYIEIKTEYASGKSTKRSYNYKVVQVKKGVQLDMRGRCSAGQKVLACLIIRMALADTLSSNCGILALDEPTTNLDRENIHSLSETLSRIVETRQKEKNFQLLIITHDEEFLNSLTRVQSVSHYYRIMRNDEGFSVIKKEYSL